MSTQNSRNIKVLIVDDSAVARAILEKGLSSYPYIEIVGKAADAWTARDKIVLLQPDVVTLDIEMPGMNGTEFLAKLIPQYPIPVIVVSGLTLAGSEQALKAMQAGALDVVSKPSASTPEDLQRMLDELAEKIQAAAKADIRKLKQPSSVRQKQEIPKPSKETAPHYLSGLIVIGASTGGTTVLNSIIPKLPHNAPPVLIVQHMPPIFTRLFAESLNRNSAVTVKEAEDGMRIVPGQVLVAPGDKHLTVEKNGVYRIARCSKGLKINGHCPSVDVLFACLASLGAKDVRALLLTGMGRDGAEGLLQLRKAGARCFAQNEESSVVFGMPAEAWKLGAAERLLDIDSMIPTLLETFKEKPFKKRVS